MFTIRGHKDDPDVFELITVSSQTGKIIVWAIILKDFLYDAKLENAGDISLELKVGKEFECELVIKKGV